MTQEAKAKLILMDSQYYSGDADFIFTHPYARLPKQLLNKPMILNTFVPFGKYQERKVALGEYVKGVLHDVGCWGKGLNNFIFTNRLPQKTCELYSFVEDEFLPGRGWMPEGLIDKLLDLYQEFLKPGCTIWDGFCGRGTIGKVCLRRGYNYVGIDNKLDRIEIAKLYLS